jgi:hypothetical protein
LKISHSCKSKSKNKKITTKVKQLTLIFVCFRINSKTYFMLKSYAFFIFMLFSIAMMAQTSGSVNGVIRDAVNGRPAEGATVSIDKLQRRTTTDSLGQYRIIDLPVGTYSISVSAIGFEIQTKYNLPITSGNSNEVSFDLLRATATLNNVTVSSTRRTARATSLETPLSVQRLTTEEIRSNPGGNFDISRVVQSLPGITSSNGIGNGYRNDIIIRGGAPSENVYYLDGIEVPVINHFSTQGSAGGPQGILNVSFIEDLRISTSAFDARYDNALSGIFEFKQKNGNINRVQGNIRLSASELAATFDGPISKKLTFLASARRSYLQLLFKAIDLPIRPDYYDFQYKLSYVPNAKNSFSFIGIGAIDKFQFGTIKNPTLEKYFILDNAPLNNQWNYTVGGSWKRSLQNGFVNVSLSRNVLDISLVKYDGNEEEVNKLRLNTATRETENKVRLDASQTVDGWKISYGTSIQYVDYFNNSFVRRRAAVTDANGVEVQPADIFRYDTNIDFWRYGLYTQVGKRFFEDRFNFSAGIRGDGNSFLTRAENPLKTLSPRIAVSYIVASKWTINASAGSYTRLPAYTIIGFQQDNIFFNKNADYIRATHYVTGLEYLPKPTLRFTLEGFYKKYANVPVSLRDGISLNNLGADFTAVGNEPVASVGGGEAYGVEIFAQQKLTQRLFGFVSYTYVISKFSGLDGNLLPSAWDNRHLASFTLGYKLKRNWEVGLKYRLQGGLPYTPFDEAASRRNYITLGNGILDYSRFNQLRLNTFQQSDLRIDKKWNFKKITLDLFIDVQNWTAFKTPVLPQYTFDRDLETRDFITTDGQPIKRDGSNAVPQIFTSNSSTLLPTIGFILEF